MRSAIIAAAFAALAVAVPLEGRDVVTATDVDVVYVTDYYTVTGGARAKPTTTCTDKTKATPVADASHGKQQYAGNWGHNNPNWWNGGRPNKGHGHKHKPKPKPTTSTSTYEVDWDPTPTQVYTKPKPTKTKTTAPKPPKPTNTSGGGSPSDTSYQGKVVYHHNVHRANHSAPNVQWDAGLAATAQKIADSCVYAHDTDMDGGGYGQNIAAGVDASGIDKVISNMFYNGEVNLFAGYYGMASPPMDNFEAWGHFSQIVWKGTTHVGCATKSCSSLGNTGGGVQPFFTVCNYKSPGNYAGEYGANIGKSLNHPTVAVDDNNGW